MLPCRRWQILDDLSLSSQKCCLQSRRDVVDSAHLPKSRRGLGRKAQHRWTVACGAGLQSRCASLLSTAAPAARRYSRHRAGLGSVRMACVRHTKGERNRVSNEMPSSGGVTFF